MPDEQTLRLPLQLVPSLDAAWPLFMDLDRCIVPGSQYPAIVSAVNQAPALQARIGELTAELAKERLLVDVTREAAMVRQVQAERAEARVTELVDLLERLSQADALGVTPDAPYWRMLIRDALDAQTPAAGGEGEQDA